MERLTGIGVSPGVAVGRAVILTLRTDAIRFPIPPDRIEREVALLHAARDRSRQQLQEIRNRVQQARGAELAAVFDAQIMMLDDALFVGRAEELIRTEQVNAGWAVHRAYEELRSVFASVEDEYLRDRETDVADVAGRLRMNLRSGRQDVRGLLSGLEGPTVLIADELTASLAAQLDWTRIEGFALDAGSRTYHTAILARSLKVPAIVGLHDASARVAAGTLVVLDGRTGELLIDPPSSTVEAARCRAAQAPGRTPASTPTAVAAPAVTRDGVPITLQANVELIEDLGPLRALGAEGVGLYRSEFMLSGRPLWSVTEDAQYALYRHIVEQVAPHPATIRTFDVDERAIGARPGDRRHGGRPGLRGLRLGLARPDLLCTQLRALVRASAHGTLRVMFPFVTGVEEVREARRLLAEAAADIGRPAPPAGAMVEVPAAAIAADLLAREVDFLTIGTNDLIQYCLAVDRTDDRMSEFYAPLHPAVLRLIRLVCRAARRRGVPVSLCGEMASDPALLGVLIGLGLTAFSMTPAAIPAARQVIGDLDAGDARALARRVLALPTAKDIERCLLESMAAPAAPRDA